MSTVVLMRSAVELIQQSRQTRNRQRQQTGQNIEEDETSTWNPHFPPDALITAEELKKEGTQLFKEGNFEGASIMYQKAVECLSVTAPSTEEQKQTVERAIIPCLLNRAACDLKLKAYQQCVSACSRVLTREPNNVKALFRRSVAYFHLKEFDLALEDCSKAAELEPEDQQIKKLLKEIKTAAENSRKREAELFKNMFR